LYSVLSEDCILYSIFWYSPLKILFYTVQLGYGPLKIVFCIVSWGTALCLTIILRVLQVKVSRSKVVSSFFIDDIFYVVIVFKIHEVIYLRKRQYITGDILLPWGAWSVGATTSENLFYLIFIINFMSWGIYLTKMPHALDVSCYIQ
jgi:hypothetical protein